MGRGLEDISNYLYIYRWDCEEIYIYWWDCEEREPLCNCCWKCKLVQPRCKTIWEFLKKVKKDDDPHDPVISLLGIYPKELKSGSWRNSCTPMFIAALFTIARILKQPKCPSIDEWIRKENMAYTCNRILLILEKRRKSYNL